MSSTSSLSSSVWTDSDEVRRETGPNEQNSKNRKKKKEKQDRRFRQNNERAVNETRKKKQIKIYEYKLRSIFTYYQIFHYFTLNIPTVVSL